MRIVLDRETGTPVNRQIADQLRGEVAAGRLASGARLPAIRDLARELGVNRDTVATAYERLSAEGVLESTVGRGTFVAESGGAAAPKAAEPTLAPQVERLLDFERARARYPEKEGAVSMHALVPSRRSTPWTTSARR